MKIVDVDHPASWTPQIHDFVDEYAERLRDTTESTSDLRISPEEDDEFRSLLVDSPLRVYHATRLLDHEVEAIRIEGLIPLTAELVRTRIERAGNAGYLTDAEREDLIANNLFDGGHDVSNREDQVAFFLSGGVLDHAVWGIRHPLTTWGGEGIYFGVFNDRTKARLKLIGRPSIVVAAVDLSPSRKVHLVFPGVLRSFVGRAIGHAEYESDVLYRAPVPGEHILDIWQPGRPEYDRHPELPIDVPDRFGH